MFSDSNLFRIIKKIPYKLNRDVKMAAIEKRENVNDNWWIPFLFLSFLLVTYKIGLPNKQVENLNAEVRNAFVYSYVHCIFRLSKCTINGGC